MKKWRSNKKKRKKKLIKVKKN